MPRDLFTDENKNQPRDLFAEEEKSIDPRIKELDYATGQNRNLVDSLRDVAAGAIGGLGKGGQTIASLATGGYAPQVDFDAIENAIRSPNKSMGGEILRGAGEYAPYGAAGGTSLLGQALAGGASGAALTKEGESNVFGLLPSGKLGGAIESSLLNMLTHGALKGAEKLRPSKMFRGELSEKELARNLALTQGTETGLGDVIGSPFLKKRLENTLTSLPFSSANESLQRTGKEVTRRGENILNDLLGDHEPHTVPQKIADDLNELFKQREIEKTGHYTKFNDLSKQENLKLDLNGFSKTAKKYEAALRDTNLLQSEPEAASLLNRLTRYADPIPVEEGRFTANRGKYEPYNPKMESTENINTYPNAPIINPKIETQEALNIKNPERSKFTPLNASGLVSEKTIPAKEALLLKGKLNALANQAASSSDANQRGLAKVFGSLASSLGKDIRGSVSETKNPKLINALNQAEENYKNNFSGFLDKEIYKYIGGEENPETIIRNFIKNTPNADLASSITKLAKHISPQSKDLLAYGYLSRALDNEGNLNPAKLSTAIKKLGHNQLKALIPDPFMRKRLLDYSKFEGMNKEAQNLMFNPKTGQRLGDAGITALIALLGHMAGGNVPGIAAAGATVLGGKVLTKALTSPSIRESLVNRMIENKPRFDTSVKKKSAEVLSQSILNAMKRE